MMLSENTKEALDGYTLVDIAKEQNGRIFTVDSKINKLIVASETKKKSWF